MNTIGVMQMIDTLDVGGAERVALNLANQLPRERYRSFLCTTRHDGALAAQVAGDVGRLRLNRTRRIEPSSIARLSRFIRSRRIGILHAHGTALLTAVLASCLPPYPAVIWHDHFGRFEEQKRPVLVYRALTARTRAVITVNNQLADWARDELRLPEERVWQVPNFVVAQPAPAEPPDLPGRDGLRLICVANLRPEKDHYSLLRAMAFVVRHEPEAHLLLVGTGNDAGYAAGIRSMVRELGLDQSVSFLGQRLDVPALLQRCEVGVLSSVSEALPLALIEYGMAGLACVSTDVGECAGVLDDGRAGLLLQPGRPEQMGKAMLHLLRNPQLRLQLGERLRRRTCELYSADSVLKRIESIYTTVLGGSLEAE